MDSTSLNPLNCQWITNGQIAASYIDDLWEWSSLYSLEILITDWSDTPKNEKLEPQTMAGP